MKRLLLATALLAVSATLSAQQKVVTVYSMTRQQQEQYTNANVNGISANGQYAVGSAVELSTDAFIWNRATGQFQQIKGSFNNSATAYAVSNEGKVVGTFYSDNNGEVPEDGTAYVIPGVWEDGVWTALELELPMHDITRVKVLQGGVFHHLEVQFLTIKHAHARGPSDVETVGT